MTESTRQTDEVTLQGLLEYSTSEQVYDLGDVISFTLQQNEEIERMRPVVEAAKRHAKYNELIGKSFCTCDICKSHRDYEAKKP